MPRIRSIHPGIFTDEEFMTASALARLLIIGLWTEADDQGVFEWKPVTLKARIFPADNVDVEALLDELQALNFVRKFGHEAKNYGAIRNFLRWQKPRKPQIKHPLSPDLSAFIGTKTALSHEGDEDFGADEELEAAAVRKKSVLMPVKEASVPQKSEKSSLMEEGGGKMEDISLLPSVGECIAPISQNHSQANDLVTLAEQTQAVEAWNQLAERLNLSKVQRLTGPRKTKLRRRLAECGGIAGWHEALGKLEKIPWLLGDNDRGWKADFDFLCQEKSFTRLMEGSYDRDQNPSNSAGFKRKNGPVSIVAIGAEIAAQFAGDE